METNEINKTVKDVTNVSSGCGCNDSTDITEKPNSTCCSGVSPKTKLSDKSAFVIGEVETFLGTVPKVETKLSIADWFGALGARTAFNRMNYKVEPGLYAIGNPDENSEVLISANYKLSFDALRKELTDMNVWILVIDTKGINVWCAAGKGTFGTDEIVNRINCVQLSELVFHKRIIVPQLGAPGVEAHLVQKRTGFRVVYAPVRAKDIKLFFQNNRKTTQEMRQVEFNMWDRFVLTPIEFLYFGKPFAIAFAVLFILSGISKSGFNFNMVLSSSKSIVFYLLISLMCGTFLTPLLLPYIPGRAFAVKGFAIGLIASVIVWFFSTEPFIMLAPWLLAIPALSSVSAMFFTGASTYTSLSGVLKEMKIAMPIQITVLVICGVYWLIGRFV